MDRALSHRLPMLEGCPGLVSHDNIVTAVTQTRFWHERRRHHLFVAMHWARTPWAAKDLISNHANVVSHKGDAAGRGYLLRAFFENRWFDPMLAEDASTKAGRPQSQRNADVSTSPGATGGDFLVVAPYVDNVNRRGSDDLHRRQEVQGDDIEGGTGSVAQRSIDFFFGGQGTPSAGPGRFHVGYYPRWQLFYQWSARPSAFERTVLIETDFGGRQVDTIKAAGGPAIAKGHLPPGWPPVRRCGNEPLKLSQQQIRRLGPRLHPSWHTGPTADFACVPPCSSNGVDLRTMTSGACYGKHDPGILMARTRFALCPRGDTPSSTRPYDAIASGAIPVIISDHVWRVGMPFQCLVPFELFTLTIDEARIATDAAGALRNLSGRMHPYAESRARVLMRHFRRDLLWRVRGSRVAENVLLDAARRAASFDGADGPRGFYSRAVCCPIVDQTDG